MMSRTLLMSCLLTLVLCMVSLAHADQICVRLQVGTPPNVNDILDVIQVGFEGVLPETNPGLIPISWRQNGLPFYLAVGSATAVRDEDVAPPAPWRVGGTVTHTSATSFGGNQACALTLILPVDAQVNLLGTGIWREQCGGASGVTITGSVRLVDCPVEPSTLISSSSSQALDANVVAAGCGGRLPACQVEADD
jgi:hypothetical protein